MALAKFTFHLIVLASTLSLGCAALWFSLVPTVGRYLSTGELNTTNFLATLAACAFGFGITYGWSLPKATKAVWDLS